MTDKEKQAEEQVEEPDWSQMHKSRSMIALREGTPLMPDCTIGKYSYVLDYLPNGGAFFVLQYETEKYPKSKWVYPSA